MRLLFICIFFLNSYIAYSQYVISTSVIYGGNVDFLFGSMTKYASGINFNDYTNIKITARDTVNAAARWKFSVYATDTQLNGELGNSLPLNNIEIQVICKDHLNATIASTLFVPITSLPQDLITNIPQTTIGTYYSMYITYRCGVTTPLLGKNSDFYFSYLLFKVSF